MPDQFLCEYGNCQETGTPITITDREAGERSRFCCREHAGLHMLRRAWQYEGQRKPEFAKSVTEAVASNLSN